jgi:flagellar hook-associated protein 1
MGIEFHTALSGLLAAQRMLQTAQNNIANAGNESYARQRVDASTNPNPAGAGRIEGQMGSGVMASQITRIRDELLIQQSRTESGKIGYYGGLADILMNIESVFGETGDNALNTLLKNMFNSFEEVGKFPEQSSYRIQAVNDAKVFTQKVKNIAEQLDVIKSQTDTKITSDVRRVNELLNNIADVHKRMQNIATDSPNALLDERDKYLDELAGYIDVDVQHKGHPMNMEIRVGNVTLLSGVNVEEVEPYFVPTTQKWVLGASDVEFKPKSGTLAGYLETRNTSINQYEKDLDVLVGALITEVNALHSTGFGLDGTTGMDFFVGTDIRTIGVDALFETNPEKLGISSALGVSGNSDIGKAIAMLRDADIVAGTDPINYYQGYVVDMGSDLNVAISSYEVHTSVYQAVTSQRQSVQGVNIDEEMTNLMTYQHYYQANARTIKAMEKLNEELLALI